MAKRGAKPGNKHGKQFQEGNPGRIPKPYQVQEIRRLTALEIEEVASMLLQSKMALIAEIVNDPDASVLKRWFASCIITGIKESDMSRLNAVLDRTIGRVKQHIEVSTAEPFIFEALDGTKTIMGIADKGRYLEHKEEEK